MHELSIALSMIEMASDEVVRHGGRRVTALHLKLGQLSGVAKEALTFSWEIACQGTALEGSQLIIEETQGRELEVVALEIEEIEELVT
jgi:hydrogenase nickel incorporation protein HypA/HybF